MRSRKRQAQHIKSQEERYSLPADKGGVDRTFLGDVKENYGKGVDAVMNALSPKNPQKPGNENKHGVKIKDKTNVPRNPKPAPMKSASMKRSPQGKSAREKRLTGKRL